MKYNFRINQFAVIQNGLNERLDIVDIALFDFVYDLMNSPDVPKTHIGGTEYTQIRHALVSAQCPLLGINHRDTFRKRMSKLVDSELLIRYERNQEENQSMYARGPKFSLLVFSSRQSGDLPQNNNTLPLNVDTTCRQQSAPPVDDERHDNTINEYSISENINKDNSSRINTSKNISSIPKKEKKGLDLSFVGVEYIGIIERWLKYKSEKRQSYTQSGIESQYRRLLMLSNQDARVADQIVEYSIAQNYNGIYVPDELKQKQNNNGNSTQTQQPVNRYVEFAKAVGATNRLG